MDFKIGDEVVYVGCPGPCIHHLTKKECRGNFYMDIAGIILSIEERNVTYKPHNSKLAERGVFPDHLRLVSPLTPEEASNAISYDPNILKKFGY